MDKLIEFLERHLFKVVGIPFVAELMLALADGKISQQEFHQLSDGARWVELVVLGLVMAYLKFKDKDV